MNISTHAASASHGDRGERRGKERERICYITLSEAYTDLSK